MDVLAKRANARRTGAFYFDFTAMILSFAVIESYLNFVIQVMDPALFAQERKKFRGPLTKLAWACKKAKWNPDQRRRPFTTLRRLKELRDLAMHAKPDVYKTVRYHNGEAPFPGPGRMARYATRENRRRAQQDVSAFCETLHEKLLLLNQDHERRRRLEPFALQGSTLWQTRHTSLNLPPT